MRIITHVNESCRTFEWVVSRTSPLLCLQRRQKAPKYIYIYIYHRSFAFFGNIYHRSFAFVGGLQSSLLWRPPSLLWRPPVLWGPSKITAPLPPLKAPKLPPNSNPAGTRRGGEWVMAYSCMSHVKHVNETIHEQSCHCCLQLSLSKAREWHPISRNYSVVKGTSSDRGRGLWGRELCKNIKQTDNLDQKKLRQHCAWLFLSIVAYLQKISA